MSNKYVDRMGVNGPELSRQIEALKQIEKAGNPKAPLVVAETKLWRGLHSKDYHEPVEPKVLSLIPERAGSVLSIGCGQGATESPVKNAI